MIADTIKEIRKNSNMTQSEFAKKLGITRSSINAWEMGISVPSTQYVVELANLFNVSTDYILGLSTTKLISIYNLSDNQVKVIYTLLACFKQGNDEP
ncbi:MAG: helix-turn-helix transcriptional regulator [Bacilli bacterium]